MIAVAFVMVPVVRLRSPLCGKSSRAPNCSAARIGDQSPIACGRDPETPEFTTMPSCSLTAMGDQRDWTAIDGCPDLRVDERQVPRLRGPRK